MIDELVYLAYQTNGYKKKLKLPVCSSVLQEVTMQIVWAASADEMI